MSTNTSDVVILGGGSGGYACAIRAAQQGKSVTLIEEDKVGGTCLHRGCIPTKALIHVAEVADTVATASAVGVDAQLGGIDLDLAQRYQGRIVDRLYKGLQGLLGTHGIETVNGSGQYIGGTSVKVADRTYTGRSVVLATGAEVRSVPGLEFGGRIVSSDGALSLPSIPKRAVVLGGGVIGAEFASIWSSLGAEVTVIEALPRLVAAEDEWSSRHLAKAFAKRGITVKSNTRFVSAVQGEDGVTVSVDTGESIDADLLLVAVGRSPRTAGFAEYGITLDKNGFVEVDDVLRTSVANVFAVGDIVAGPQLAHRGFQHGLSVASSVSGVLSPTPADESIPRVVYTSPEVASVGLTERQAGERFGTISSKVYDLSANGKSLILGTRGGVKVIQTEGGAVVGIHMVGGRISELIGEAQLIVNWGALPEDVAPLIHAHPTQSEALGEIHLALAGTPLHTHM